MIKDGALVPETNYVFLLGKPMCAFGYALANIGYRRDFARSNDAILTEYLNVGFGDISIDTQCALARLASSIESANDIAFSRAFTPPASSRGNLVELLLEEAECLDQIT